MASKPSIPKAVVVGHKKILATVLIYAAFAATWILLSDRLVNVLFSEPGQIIQVSMFKGWFYVVVTSILLYALLRRWFYAVESEKQTLALTNQRLKIPILVLAIAIVVFTFVGVIMTFKQHQDDLEMRFQAVTNLKSKQIADWIKERHGDAEFVQTSVFFAELYRQWQETGDQSSGEKLQTRMQQLIKSWGLEGISLIDAHGKLIWYSDHPPTQLKSEQLQMAGLASMDGNIRLVNPYRDTTGRVLLDFVAPLTAMDHPLPAPVVVLHIDLTHWLFPNLDTLPIVSKSGETLLMRRDGDQVVYLSQLRFKPDTAAKLHISLNTPKLLAAQVLLKQVEPGKRIEGGDYRNIAAQGVANSVEGTDWYLLIKMDQAEIIAQATEDALWVVLVGILALFIIGVCYYLLQQAQQLTVAQATQETQAERLRALNLLAAIADSSDDAIFAKDLQGRYILFNHAASAFTGKAVEEVLGHDDTVLFPKEQAANLMATGKQVMTDRCIINDEESLTTVAGERIFHATKGPLYDNQGNVIGIFGISRDITTRKSIVAALSRQSEELLNRNRELERFNNAMVGRELEMIKLKQQVNDLSQQLGQNAPYNLDFMDESLPFKADPV